MTITAGPLEPTAGQIAYGQFDPSTNTITIAAQALNEDPRALAAVLAHEISHAGQFAAGDRLERDCVRRETDGHQGGAVVWGSFWSGTPPRRTALERQLSRDLAILTTEGKAGLQAMVVSESGYQEECHL